MDSLVCVARGASVQKIGGVAPEARAAAVGGLKRRGGLRLLLPVQAVVQNLLDGEVLGHAEAHCAGTGGFEPDATEGLAQADHALGCPKVVQHAVGEQALDHGVAGRADGASLKQTPLGIAHEVGLGIRGQVILSRGALAGFELARVDGDEFVVAIDAHDPWCQLHPELLADQSIGGGVVALVDLNVAIAVQLGLDPDRALGSDSGQRLQQGLLEVIEHPQRLLPCRAVHAVAGLAEDPRPQLLVCMGNTVEFAQRREASFDEFDPGFHAALLLGVGHGARVDAELISECQVRVGALHLRLVVTRLGDCALEVVDSADPRNAAPEFERMAMTGKPSGDRLIAHHLGVVMAAPSQGRDEEPGLERLATDPVGDRRAHAKIDLRHLRWFKVENDRGVASLRRVALKKAVNRMDRTREPVVARKCGTHGRGTDTLPVPCEDQVSKGLHRGQVLGALRLTRKPTREIGIARQRRLLVEPPRLERMIAYLGHRIPADTLRSGNLSRRIALSQAMDDVSQFVHLKPPVSHRVSPLENPGGYAIGSSSPTDANVLSGRFMPQMGWPVYAASRLAGLCRESGGLIMPRPNWPCSPAN